MVFIVRFVRETVDDLEVVARTFPQLAHDSPQQFREQFKLELSQNAMLRGLWTVLRLETGTDQYCVWVGFRWTATLGSLVTTLQRTYDEQGMAGSFEVLDPLPVLNPVRYPSA
jgi:hypothetical protein